MAAEVKMYGTRWCPYCVRARLLLDEKGVPYEDIRVDGDWDARRWLMEASGRHTVPQIFINGTPIGGFDELYALERTGKLDALLAEPAAE